MLVSLIALFLAACLLPAGFGHYTFSNLIHNEITYGDYQYIRRTFNYQSYYPLFDLNSTQLRCFQDNNIPDPGTLTVKAGEDIGFVVSGRIIHEGPLLWYMARAPTGQTAASMDGSGPVWFKINETHPFIGTTPAPLDTFAWPWYSE
ncbi:hypothetical protein AA313_de0209621 [Arthrobotrys entomopaga]|nr:hypothetical protein AA313_de0209621 [Arthrobotrys entomopaga]